MNEAEARVETAKLKQIGQKQFWSFVKEAEELRHNPIMEELKFMSEHKITSLVRDKYTIGLGKKEGKQR